MVNIDPQQELFTALKLNIKAEGYDVYDTALPPENAPYPFVYMGDFQQIDERTKDVSIGDVAVTIHVYGLSNKRGSVSKAALDIKKVCARLKRTINFSWAVKGGISAEIRPDTTTATSLVKATIYATFEFL